MIYLQNFLIYFENNKMAGKAAQKPPEGKKSGWQRHREGDEKTKNQKEWYQEGGNHLHIMKDGPRRGQNAVPPQSLMLKS